VSCINGKFYRVRYKDENDPGCPVFSCVLEAHSKEHARERFYEGPDGDGWEILTIQEKQTP